MQNSQLCEHIREAKSEAPKQGYCDIFGEKHDTMLKFHSMVSRLSGLSFIVKYVNT